MGVIVVNPYINVGFTNTHSALYDGVDEGIYVDNQTAHSFAPNDAFSASAWIRLTGSGSNIIGKYGPNEAHKEWWFFTSSGALRIRIRTRNANAFIGIRSANSILSNNTWYFVTCTYNGNGNMSGISLYVNGVNVDNAEDNGNIYSGMIQAAYGLWIGGGGFDSGANAYTGYIFHPAVWNKELSLAEIAEIQTAKENDLRNISCGADLISAWKFNSGVADYPTYTDYKGGYNGTMTNQESADITTTVP